MGRSVLRTRGEGVESGISKLEVQSMERRNEKESSRMRETGSEEESMGLVIIRECSRESGRSRHFRGGC